MIRIILGILAGYLGMAIVVMTSILAAAFAVGTDRLIDPQTNQISTWFIIVAEWPISLVAAIIGGVIAALVAGREGRGQAVKTLAFVILIIGFLSAAFQLFAEKRDYAPDEMVEAELVGPAANEAEITAVADEKADETGTKDVRLEELPDKPIWDSIALPLLGAVGVMLGGGIVEPRRKGALGASLGD